MAKAPRGSNLRKPWAWAAAVAALGLVLASSTAIYVINPGVRLPLPWWTAIAAPAAVYALVLPLCVPGLGAAGWLGGFVILAVLHAGLGAATAWLYSIVTFTSIEQAVAPAFWGFPPALVLEMVGSLVMTLPFLDALAPRQAPRRREPDGAPARAQSRRSRAADARPAPAAAPRTQDDAAARQAWGRGGGRTEVPDQPALARPVDSGTVASLVAAVASGSAAAVAAPAAPVVAPPGPGSLPAAVEAGHDNGAAPEPRALEASPVAAPPLDGINGSAVESHEALESRGAESAATAEASPGAEAALPDYRQALRELFGAPGAVGMLHRQDSRARDDVAGSLLDAFDFGQQPLPANPVTESCP